jgi:hypothetical protein
MQVTAKLTILPGMSFNEEYRVSLINGIKMIQVVEEAKMSILR